jgi:uridine kinase
MEFETKVILIAGGSSSGKSSISSYIKKIIGADSVCIVRMDWFYNEVPSGSSGEEHNWDHPDSFDWDALINTVKKLKSGEPAQVPKHDFSKYKRIDNYKTIYPQSIIIVDGLFTLYNEKLIEMATYKIFVLCDEDISLSRRLKRDTEERGYSHEVVIERYFRHVKPSFRDYINPTKRRADIIIQNMGFCIEKNKGVEILIKCLTYTH